MSVRERLVAWTLVVVLFTAAAVAWLDRVVGLGTGSLGGVAALAAFGSLVAWGFGRALVLAPLEDDLARLADAVRRRAQGAVLPPEREPDLAAMRASLQTLIDELEAEAVKLRIESRTATEVLETSPFGIALTDAEGHFEYANPTFRSMFRLRGEPVGKRPLEVVPSVDVHEVVEAALEGRRVEIGFTTPTHDLVARGQPLGRGGAIVRVEDVTGRREAERARTDFVANVSHELRTPVTAIMGYTETLLQDRDRMDPDLVPLLETVDRNARRLRDLFEDLLRLHRIEARRRELPVTRQRLKPILEAAVGPAMDRAKMRDQTFELECPEDLEGLVNPDALGAIIGNLAANASAYTPEGGRVTVRAIADPHGPRIEVVDNGIGIAERHHERIFERFYRVDDARSRRVGGTGLGLAIVKHYALASRCHVSLKSREGEGSTFIVQLPEH